MTVEQYKMTYFGLWVLSLYASQYGQNVPKFAVRLQQNTIVPTDSLFFSFTSLYTYMYIYI